MISNGHCFLVPTFYQNRVGTKLQNEFFVMELILNGSILSHSLDFEV